MEIKRGLLLAVFLGILLIFINLKFVSAISITPIGTITSINGNSSLLGINCVAVSGDYAYTTSWLSDNLAVWNISAHGNPVFLGNYTASSGTYSLDAVMYVAVVGNYAYTISQDDDTFAVFNISSHGNPVPIGTYTNSLSGVNTLNAVGRVIVKDGYAYTTTYSESTFSIWNVTASGNPVPRGGYTSTSGNYSLDGVQAVAVEGNYAYTVSYNDANLVVWNISAHGNPVPLGNYNDSDGDYSLDKVQTIVVSGDYAYTVSNNDDTFAVFNISSHGNPVPVGTYTSSGGDYSLDGAWSVAVDGNYAYTVSNTANNLIVWDISSHGNPVPLGNYNDSDEDYSIDGAKSVVVSGDYVYVAGYDDGTLVVFAIDSTPPYFTTIPANSSLDYGESLGLLFQADDETQFGTYSLGNWTNLFSINSTGWLENISSLDTGTYIINITINDSAGNKNMTWYQVNVSDTTPPVVTLISPADSISSTTDAYNFTFNVTDSSEISSCSLILDGTTINTASSINNSGGTNGMYNSSLSIATHTWSVNCTDTSGNMGNSSTRTLIVSSASVETPLTTTSGGGYAPQTYETNEVFPTEGNNFDLRYNDKIKFTVNLTNHNLTMQNFNSTSARVLIQSEPIITWIEKGILYELDLNNDSVNDVRVRYDGMNNSKAMMFIQEIVYPSEESGVTGDAVENSPELKSIKDNKSLILAVILILIIGIALFFVLHKKHRKRRYWMYSY